MRRCARCRRFTCEQGPCPACGGDTEPAADRTVVGGRFVVEEALGQGGMGRVLRAIDASTDRRVALKEVLAPKQSAVARLRHEAITLAKLRHPNVVKVYDLAEVDEAGKHASYLVMEYVPGPSLDSILRDHRERRAHVPVSRAVDIVERVASGLASAHDEGVVHRDVKPANIVVEERTGRPVLIDFGLSRVLGDDDEVGRSLGTPMYMPPEQAPGARSGPVGPSADVYSLSCVLYELLAGRRPFEGHDVPALIRSHVEVVPDPASTHRPGIEPFDPVVRRGLEKRPADRFASMRELSQALRSAVSAWRNDGTEQDPPSREAPTTSGTIDVLVVDDEEVFRKVAARCAQIALLGVEVSVRLAASGEAALEAVREHTPNLVILDHGLPGMSGIDTLVELRRRAHGGPVRVVVASANVGAVERWRFGVLGVSDFIEKPSSLPEMVALLRDIAVGAGWVRPGAT